MNQGTIGGYWPLYEDGTPVRIGDVVEAHGVPMKVRSVDVCAPDTVLFGDLAHLYLSPGKRVKRVGDAPEDVPCLCRDPDGGVGTTCVPSDEPNWHIVIDGVRHGVSNHARRAIAEALDLTTGRRTLPPGIEWPVVDGEPVVPGDVLWDAETVRRIRVDRVGFDRDGTVLVAGDGEEIRAAGIDGIAYPAGAVSLDGLTSTEPEPEQEPDSWERLAEDSRKWFVDYWSCQGIECIDCPAMVDGKAPLHRYDTSDCESAVAADIVARAKALSGVTDDE